MKVPALMRKQFEAAYPDNAKLKACAWCVIYHAYKCDPFKAPETSMAGIEHIVSELLKAFMARKAREAYEALHPLPEGFIRDPHSGYVALLTLNRPWDWQERAERLDWALGEFSIGYQAMFESIYDEEVAL